MACPTLFSLKREFWNRILFLKYDQTTGEEVLRNPIEFNGGIAAVALLPFEQSYFLPRPCDIIDVTWFLQPLTSTV